MVVIDKGKYTEIACCFTIVQTSGLELPFLRSPGMLSGREVSLQIPTVVSYHDCVPATLIPGLHLFQILMETPPPARHSLNPGSQETGSYVKIGCAS